MKLIRSENKVYIPCKSQYIDYKENKRKYDDLISKLRSRYSFTYSGDKDLMIFHIENINYSEFEGFKIEQYKPGNWFSYNMDHIFIRNL